MVEIDGDTRILLERQGYKIIGSHSAVKACHWLKEKLVRNRSCYKSKFYGIETHRCLQMTPSVAWCHHRCIFCWRPIEHTIGTEMDSGVDDPGFIIDEAIKKQRLILSGYGGNENVDRKLYEEAMHPRHVAISLAGEPTLYPRLNELIEELHKRDFTTFLVTNGMNPRAMENILPPTQLYISVEGYDENLYKKMDNPQVKNGWKLLNESLGLLNTIDTKTVIRLTLVRDFNLDKPEKFVPLIEKASPDYIEAKGYVHVGYSRRRLKREHMPTFDEVQGFSRRLADATNYNIINYSEASKVCLLA